MDDVVESQTPFPITGLDFGTAIKSIRSGKKWQRAGWNGKGLWVELMAVVQETANRPQPLPYLVMYYPAYDGVNGSPLYTTGAYVPWLASQTDILADDWQIVE